jgi:hypothetical protein
MTEPTGPVSLFEVRSTPVDGLIAYLDAMETSLKVNPLLDHFGPSLDALRIPLKVIPHRLGDHEDELLRQERARADFWRRAKQSDERGQDGPARLYTMDLRPKDAIPELLDPIEPGLKFGLILGDPGSGKSKGSFHNSGFRHPNFMSSCGRRPTRISSGCARIIRCAGCSQRGRETCWRYCATPGC